MDALALSDSADCIIDPSSYTISGTSSVVSMDSSGSLTIDSSEAIAPTTFKASVLVGSQVVESSTFKIAVLEKEDQINFAPIF